MINIDMINEEEFGKFELSVKDTLPIARYGRSVKAFATNRLRAQATRTVERKLGMSQTQFAQVDKDVRLDIIHAQTRVLVNQLKVRWKVKMFKQQESK